MDIHYNEDVADDIYAAASISCRNSHKHNNTKESADPLGHAHTHMRTEAAATNAAAHIKKSNRSIFVLCLFFFSLLRNFQYVLKKWRVLFFCATAADSTCVERRLWSTQYGNNFSFQLSCGRCWCVCGPCCANRVNSTMYTIRAT